MSKGESTRQTIVAQGTELASRVGLRGVTIGTLAESLRLSKSGLFAHFRSKDALDVAIVEYASQRFVEGVIKPALRAPRGIPRIQALFDRVLDWPARGGFSGGCPMIAAAAELDDCPGDARDTLVARQQDWLNTLAELARTAVREGHFGAQLAAEQFASEFHGIQLAHHHAVRLLRDPQADARARIAFEAVVARFKA